MADLKATPRNALLGLLADAAQGTSNFVSQPFGYANPPGEMLMQALGVPALAKTLDTASYGGGLTRGTGYARQMLPDTAEALLSVLPGGVGAKSAAPVAKQAAKVAAKELSPQAEKLIMDFMVKQGGMKMAVPEGSVLNSFPKPTKEVNGYIFYDQADPATFNYFKSQLPANATDQQVRLAIGQKNAEIMGLPAGNTPMDRAKALGFEDGHFHGTRADTTNLKSVRPNYGVKAIEQATGLRPVFTTDSPIQASEYAMRKNKGQNASVYPLMIKRDGEIGYNFNNQEYIKNKKYLDPELTSGTLGGSEWLDTMPLYHWAKLENSPSIRMEGVHDGAGLTHNFPSTVTAIVNPSIIRSRFAAFDPARINENNLLASRLLPFSIPGLLGYGMKDETTD